MQTFKKTYKRAFVNTFKGEKNENIPIDLDGDDITFEKTDVDSDGIVFDNDFE